MHKDFYIISSIITGLLFYLVTSEAQKKECTATPVTDTLYIMKQDVYNCFYFDGKEFKNINPEVCNEVTR